MVIGFLQAIINILMIFYDILKIIFHFILSISRTVFILIYNFLMYNFVVKCCGRVPVSESIIAYRVAGPGVGRNNFFYTLKKEEF